MYRLCTICARGGSKGVPNKNTTVIAGLPLIAHSIRQAQESGLFDAIAVSSDSTDILNVAAQYGAECVRRPDELATDTSAKLPAIRHCVEEFERANQRRADVIVDLDATSPLRAVSDIVASLSLLDEGASNVITACPARRSPYFNMVQLDENNAPRLVIEPRTAVARRQDSPACFDMNASIYVWKREVLFSEGGLFQSGTRLHVMPEERSIDIDSPLDLRIVELLLNERLPQQKVVHTA